MRTTYREDLEAAVLVVIQVFCDRGGFRRTLAPLVLDTCTPKAYLLHPTEVPFRPHNHVETRAQRTERWRST